MKPFNNPTAQQAIDLYHRRMREAHIAKALHMEKDGIVQFVLAGYEVQRRHAASLIGIKVKS